jgi:hypothetical protein
MMISLLASQQQYEAKSENRSQADHMQDNLSRSNSKKFPPTFWRINEFEVDEELGFEVHRSQSL